MNGSDRKKRYYTTPRGEALFARLVDPDYGTERYPDPRGSFHVTLALGAEEARRLDALLKPALEEAREFASRKAGQNRDKAGGPELSFAAPGIPERDREGSFTDRRLYRFRTNAFYQQPGGCRTRRVVPVFNAALERMELFGEPGNGSLARVAFSVAPYFIEATGVAGLSLFLDSVQILRLNRRGGLTGEEYGFCVETPESCALSGSRTRTASSNEDALAAPGASRAHPGPDPSDSPEFSEIRDFAPHAREEPEFSDRDAASDEFTASDDVLF